ncbi:FAD-dependent oxidoreductase [Patescibacteria group bacterium]|nr:FAD-dependent oxidoreductase [Patescibacteria group bacterium]
MARHVIIGGGIAGVSAAEEIRKIDPASDITLFEIEEIPCYSRVLLPHYVKGIVPREKVFLRAPDWYGRQGIDWRHGVHVEGVDVSNSFVTTSEGREEPFDTLLITTGTEVTTLPEQPRGVSYLSELGDADHLRELLAEVRAKGDDARGFIYGGGFIAFEYANIFAHYKVPFAIAMRGSGFWSKVLSSASQAVLAQHAQAKGVQVYFNEPQPEILGGLTLEGVRLSGGVSQSVDILGIGIGSLPQHSLAKAAGLGVDRGILANEYLETSLPHVYTAGDVSQAFDLNVRRNVQYGNWMNAQRQGMTVGKTMAGERTAFKLVSSYATQFLGKHVVFIGDVSREAADEVRQVVLEQDVAQEIFLRNGMVVGASLIGDTSQRAALTASIGQRADDVL